MPSTARLAGPSMSVRSFPDSLRDLPERKERNERNTQERRDFTLREHVRFGSKADALHTYLYVCFAPESGHSDYRTAGPLSANSGPQE